MALDAGSLVFVVYPKDDPLGTPSGVLEKAKNKKVKVEDNGIGGGEFSIHPDDTGASWCEQDAYVAVWRDAVAGDPLAGFWIDAIGDVVLSPDEDGGMLHGCNGRGPIAILEEAIVWHKAVSGNSGNVYPAKGEWRWGSAHPARPLVRLLEEAQARGALADVTWDFDRTTDSSGAAWSTENVDSYNVSIGTNLLDVVRELREAGLYITMDAGLVLHVWDDYDNDLSGTIGFTSGTDIRDTSEIEAAARRGKSAVLVEGENKNDALRYRARSSASIETSLGRRKEGFFRFTRTATTARLNRVGDRKLNKWKKQHDGPFTLGVIDTTSKVALVDYTVGDTVAVPTDYVSTGKERIAAITLAEIENGEYDPTIEFGDLASDPFTGNTPSGDVEGGGCCGDTPGAGKKPGSSTGGGGGSWTGGPGGGSVDPNIYVLDAFSRTILTGPTTVASSTAADSGTSVDLDLPDGIVVGNVIFGIIGWDSGSGDGDTAIVNAGWVRMATLQASGAYRFAAYFRLVDGTEGYSGSSDTLSLTGITSADMGGVFELLTDWYGTDPTGPDWVRATGTTSDPPNIADTTWPASTPVRYYTALFTDNAGTIDTPPSGYTNIGQAAVADTAMSLDSKASTTQSDSPGAYGESGGNTVLQSFTVAIRGGSVSSGITGGWGSIPQGEGVDTEAPWEGGNTYVVDSGGAVFSVSGGAGIITLTDDGVTASAELVSSDTEAWGPWSSGRGLYGWTWKVDPIGNTSDSDANTLKFSLGTEGWAGTLIVNLGDNVSWSYMDPDQQRGITVLQSTGTYSDFVAKTLASDTIYNVLFDTRGERVKAKLWAASVTEPNAWDIDVAKVYNVAYTTDWSTIIYAGQTDDTLTVSQSDAALGALPGSATGRHIVGYGDGSTVTFYVEAPFVAGSLVVWVDNQLVTPSSNDPSARSFTFSRAPYGDPADETGSSIIEASFEPA